MKSTRTASHRCTCGYVFDTASPAPGTDIEATPKAGDYTFCLRCVRVYRFEGSALTLHGLTLASVARADVPASILEAAAEWEGSALRRRVLSQVRRRK